MKIGSSFGARLEQTWGNPSWWNLLIVLPWVLGMVVMLYGFRTDEVTASRERTTTGLIVSHDPPNHDRFGYQFEVKGRRYSGWAIPSTHEYQIGEQVLVYYDPLDPSTSALDDFADSGYRVLGPVSFCLFGTCGVALYIFLRRRVIRRRQASPTQVLP
jgi:hypothetical protein